MTPEQLDLMESAGQAVSSVPGYAGHGATIVALVAEVRALQARLEAAKGLLGRCQKAIQYFYDTTGVCAEESCGCKTSVMLKGLVWSDGELARVLGEEG